MTWDLVWMILVMTAVISILISLTANSIITDIYKARTTLEMGKANNWRQIKTDQ